MRKLIMYNDSISALFVDFLLKKNKKKEYWGKNENWKLLGGKNQMW